MKCLRRSVCILLMILFFKSTNAQVDTLINKLDSLNKKTDTTGAQTNIINPQPIQKTHA